MSAFLLSLASQFVGSFLAGCVVAVLFLLYLEWRLRDVLRRPDRK